MKIRIKFTRHGSVKFLGHLDLMRYFQKAIRRADIDIKYSEGFSPHQIMSFAAPIGVGVESCGEYFDIEVHSTMSSQEAINALNATMADGIMVTQYRQLPDKTPKAMAQVAAATYELYYKNPEDNPLELGKLEKQVDNYIIATNEILVTKETKKSVREINLKPFIYDFRIIDRNGPGFFMMLSAGSIENIKPQLVLQYLYEKTGLSFDINQIQIERQDVFFKSKKGEFLPLGAAGDCIE
ncbi:TIGR03936 family radical SAM-associated protein [Eubacterium oxidoreducens]|uniref:Radical SAM-linked protein n=1 Tax=Eubacterium oxidoreducens TaxID=1732 RepID=A0A1G6ALZ5_EUBOX|nr:TIGR03936 family radical SAM-associated protein [Eubacterium oxidoreducens]SDB09419.1 radical SAM-linked protein [Eubacterium oxidoreducens]